MKKFIRVLLALSFLPLGADAFPREKLEQLLSSHELELDPSQREGIISQSLRLMTDEESEAADRYRLEIIKALKDLPFNSLEQVVSFILSLDIKNSTEYDFFVLLEPVSTALQKLDLTEKNLLRITLQDLLQDKEDVFGDSYADMIKILLNIAPSDWETFTRQLKKMITPSMHIWSISGLGEELSKIEMQDLEGVVGDSLKLVEENDSAEKVREIVRSVATLPSADRGAVVDQLLRFSKPKELPHYPKEVLEFVQSIPVARREKIIDQSLSFVKDDMDLWSKMNVIRSFLGVEEEDWSTFEEECRPLLLLMEIGDKQAKTLKFGSLLSKEKRKSIIDSLVSSHENGAALSSLLEIMAYVDQNPLQTQTDLVEQVIRLIGPSIRAQDVHYFLFPTVASFPPEQREDIVTQSLRILSASGHGFPYHILNHIVKKVESIPAAEREGIVTDTLSLVEGDTEDQYLPHILDEVAKLPAQERADSVRETLTFTLNDRHQKSYARLEVVKQLSHMSSGQRQNILSQLRRFATENHGGRDIELFIKTLSAMPVLDLEDVVTNFIRVGTFLQRSSTDHDCLIIDLLSKMSHTVRGSAVTKSLEAAEKLNSKYLSINFIEVFGQMSQESWDDFIQHVVLLSNNHQNSHLPAGAIKSLSSVPSNQWPVLMSQLDLFLKDVEQPHTRLSIIESICALPHDQRKDVLKQSLRLIEQTRETYMRDKIIKAIEKIPAVERESIVTQTLRLLTDIQLNGEHISIIETLQQLPINEREEIITQTLRVITKNMHPEYYVHAIKTIQGFPKEERQHLLDLSLQMVGRENLYVAQAIATVPADQRPNLHSAVRHFYTEGMDPEDKVSLVCAIASIRPSGWHTFVEQMDAALGSMPDSPNKVLIITQATKIPEDERLEVITQMVRVFDAAPPADPGYIYVGLKEIQKIPAGQREEVITQSLRLMRGIKLNPLLLFGWLSPLPNGYRKEALDFAERLSEADKCQCNLFYFIFPLAKIRRTEWPVFEQKVKDLFIMPYEKEEKLLILNTYWHIFPDQWENFDAHWRRLLKQEMSQEVKSLILRSLRDLPSHHWPLITTIVEHDSPEHYREDLTSVYDALCRDFPNIRHQNMFHREFMRRFNEAQVAVQNGGIPLDMESIINGARHTVTQQEGQQVQIQGRAYEIHNAANAPVKMGSTSSPLYQAIQSILENNLRVAKIPLSDAVRDIKQLIDQMAAKELNAQPQVGEDRSQKIKAFHRILQKGYGDGTDPEHEQEVAGLLGFVWPYIKSLKPATQENWLSYAMDESAHAYDGGGDTTSCGLGIQERLTVTGFIEDLEDVDYRLIKLSSYGRLYAGLLSQEVVVPDYISPYGVSETLMDQYMGHAASQGLPREMLLGDKSGEDEFKQTMKAAFENTINNDPNLQVHGFNLANDLLQDPHIQQRLSESLEMHYEYSMHYERLQDKARGITRQRLLREQSEHASF